MVVDATGVCVAELREVWVKRCSTLEIKVITYNFSSWSNIFVNSFLIEIILSDINCCFDDSLSTKVPRSLEITIFSSTVSLPSPLGLGTNESTSVTASCRLIFQSENWEALPSLSPLLSEFDSSRCPSFCYEPFPSSLIYSSKTNMRSHFGSHSISPEVPIVHLCVPIGRLRMWANSVTTFDHSCVLGINVTPG